VHVIIATNRWAEIRPAMKDLLTTRFELRLGDPSESEIDRRTQVNVPVNRPGRGLSQDKLHFLTALPRIDGVSNPDTTSEALQGLIARVSGGREGVRAPRVRLLPDKIGVEELRQARGRDVPVGVNESDLDTVFLDFDAEPHFMAFADGESGKTNLLRTIVRGIMRAYTPQEALIFLVDYRRTLLGFVNTDHLLVYGVSGQQVTEAIHDVSASLKKRLPGPDVTQEQLRNRSWWSGPDLFVVVDDYDLVAPQGGVNPLQPLAEYLSQAKDVGLHVVTARRTGGTSRAMYDPVLGRLRELAAPLFLGSGSREEGNIVGNLKPSPQPPGRGTLVTRKHGQQRMQFAWTDPD
jgi:S-DNA-T family DNA segregation ATPase FtsK/SpoIIIE